MASFTFVQSLVLLGLLGVRVHSQISNCGDAQDMNVNGDIFQLNSNCIDDNDPCMYPEQNGCWPDAYCVANASEAEGFSCECYVGRDASGDCKPNPCTEPMMCGVDRMCVANEDEADGYTCECYTGEDEEGNCNPIIRKNWVNNNQ